MSDIVETSDRKDALGYAVGLLADASRAVQPDAGGQAGGPSQLAARVAEIKSLFLRGGWARASGPDSGQGYMDVERALAGWTEGARVAANTAHERLQEATSLLSRAESDVSDIEALIRPQVSRQRSLSGHLTTLQNQRDLVEATRRLAGALARIGAGTDAKSDAKSSPDSKSQPFHSTISVAKRLRAAMDIYTSDIRGKPALSDAPRTAQRLSHAVSTARDRVVRSLIGAVENHTLVVQNEPLDVARAAEEGYDVSYTAAVQTHKSAPGGGLPEVLEAASIAGGDALEQKCLRIIAQKIEKKLVRPLVAAAARGNHWRVLEADGGAATLAVLEATQKPTQLSQGKDSKQNARDRQVHSPDEALKAVERCGSDALALVAAAAHAMAGRGRAGARRNSVLVLLGYRALGCIERELIKAVLAPAIPRRVGALSRFRQRCTALAVSFSAAAVRHGLRVKGGPTAEEASRKMIRTRLSDWLSGVGIGGREERYFDPTAIVEFGVRNGLEDAEPEEIYRKFVDEATKQGESKAHADPADPMDAELKSKPLPATLVEFSECFPGIFRDRVRRSQLVRTRALVLDLSFQAANAAGNDDAKGAPSKVQLQRRFPAAVEAAAGFRAARGRAVSVDAIEFAARLSSVVEESLSAIQLATSAQTDSKRAADAKILSECATALYSAACDSIELFLAMLLPQYEAKILQSAHVSCILYNDCLFIANRALALHTRHARAVLLAPEQLRLAVQASELRLCDFAGPATRTGKRCLATFLFAFRQEQLRALAPLTTVRQLESAREVERAMELTRAALEVPKRVASAWKGIVGDKERVRVAQLFCANVATALVDTAMARDEISQRAAEGIRALTGAVQEFAERQGLATGGWPEQGWARINALHRILGQEMTLAELRTDFVEGAFSALSGREISRLVSAIWADSEKRAALLAKLESNES